MKKQKAKGNTAARARKLAKRKAALAQRSKQAAAPRSDAGRARAASAAEIHFCGMTSNLFEEGIGYIILARRATAMSVASSVFLVDVHCMGVKVALFGQRPASEFRDLMSRLEGGGSPVVEIEPACARKILEGAAAYARDIGLPPHADYPAAAALFGDVESSACPQEYTFGDNGRPRFAPGPEDTPATVRKVLDTLTAKLGDGNFEAVLPTGTL